MTILSDTARADEILHSYFGFRAFRHGQNEIIDTILESRDTLVVIPTGGGKSLCYQIPALMCEGTALVISPLIALMKDQVDALHRANIPATFINSSLHLRDMQHRMQQARSGAYKLLYVAPERLESAQFVEQLRDIQLSFLAVDEAHCISEWGHDFRPSYQNIPTALSVLPRLPVIALTATATAEVRQDIVRALHMKDARTFVRGFDRPNLSYRCESSSSKIERVQQLLKTSVTGSTIIYCGSRRKVEDAANTLKRGGLNCAAYHAGMHEMQRTEIQEKFISGEIPVLTATSAFGMGVDKSDVRNVIHLDLTLTLEAYYQEAGRAGRDGEPSTCTILHQPNDRGLQEFFLRCTYPQLDDIQSVYSFLYETLGAARGHKPLNALFMDDVAIANRLNLPSATVSGVLGLLERNDLIRRGSLQNKATLQLTAESDRLREYFHQTTPERREVLEALLRGVGPEALRNSVSLDIHALVHKHDIPYDQFHNAIRAFEYARLMRYVPAAANGGIALTRERSALDAIPIDFQALKIRRDRAFRKLDVVQRYIETTECKRNFLLQYFDDSVHDEKCGRCSSCLSTTTQKHKPSAQEQYTLRCILRTVYELRERFGRTTIAQVLNGMTTPKSISFGLERSEHFGVLKTQSVRDIVEHIDGAIHRGYLALSADMYPVLKLQPKGSELIRADVPQMLDIQYTAPTSVSNDPLVQTLKRVRKDIASRNEVPPYSILSDEQVLQIVKLQPTQLDDFLSVKGLSHVFVHRYGAEFLRVLKDDRASDIQEQRQKSLSASVEATIELIRGGSSLHDAAQMRGISVGTIAAHVQEALEFGIDIQRRLIVDDEVYASVRKVLRRNPRAFLKELRAELGGTHDVAELRVAAAFVRRDMKAANDTDTASVRLNG